jgi:serine/threonine protein phosphatase PrpC
MAKGNSRTASDLFRSTDGVYASQIRGAREYQEDAVVYKTCSDGKSLVVALADGMGGHHGGEIASNTAVESFLSAFLSESPERKLILRLYAGLIRANDELASLVRARSELDGMGTTLLAAVFAPSGVSWLSVGDSLLLRIRGRDVRRVNDDHSMAPLLDDAARNGTLTKEQANSHKDRNSLRSAVMGSPIELIDVNESPMAFRRGDVWLLASDGLLTLDRDEICALVNAHKSNGSKAIANSLLEAVSKKSKPRQDNTTVAVVILDKSSSKLAGAEPTSRHMWLWGFFVGVVFSLGAYTFFQQSALSGYVDAIKNRITKILTLYNPGARSSGSDEPQPIDLEGIAVDGSSTAPLDGPVTPPKTNTGDQERLERPGASSRSDVQSKLGAADGEGGGSRKARPSSVESDSNSSSIAQAAAGQRAAIRVDQTSQSDNLSPAAPTSSAQPTTEESASVSAPIVPSSNSADERPSTSPAFGPSERPPDVTP